MSAVQLALARARTRGNAVTVALSAAVGCGIVLRAVELAHDRSLLIDEAKAALSIARWAPDRLIHQPLNYAVAAPPGFLVLEHEMSKLSLDPTALRVIPFLASSLALPVFAYAARRLLHGWAAVVAVAWLVSADLAVYYASEIKPYAIDLLATTIALSILAWPRSRDWRVIVTFGIGGAVMLFFSFGAAFVLAGLAVALAWDTRGDRAALAAIAASSGGWFAAVTESRRLDIGLQSVNVQGAGTRLVFPRNHVEAKQMVLMLNSPFHLLGLPRALTVVAVLLSMVGVVAIWRRNTPLAVFSIVVIVLPFVLSADKRYFIAYRTVLFLLPVVILLVIEGVYMVARDRRLAARAIMVGLLALPLAEAFAHVGRSRADQDVKDALTFVDAHYRSGDTLVVSHDAQYAAGYYALCDCLNFHRLSLKAVAGTVEAKSPALASTSGVIVQQLTPLPRLHGRLWLLDASETPDTDVRSMISSPVTLVYRAAGVAVFTTRR